jgi:hypothetical protein
MEVEDIARVRFSARWPPHQQGNLPIRPGMLGQVIVDDQGMATAFHDLFAHRTTSVRGDVLQCCRIRCGRSHDDRMLHRAVPLERRHSLCDLRTLLTDRHVDADDTFPF